MTNVITISLGVGGGATEGPGLPKHLRPVPPRLQALDLGKLSPDEEVRDKKELPLPRLRLVRLPLQRQRTESARLGFTTQAGGV